MPSLQRTPANIRINLTLLETTIPVIRFCRWQCRPMRSSASFRTVSSEIQKRQYISCRARNRFQRKTAIQGHIFRCHWKATKWLHSTM